MPTAVNIAKQCLTVEASHALDEAVNVARKRGHSQTTSLHTVSALLSLPTSVLRDACARVRNSAYSHRLQFKALDLCLSVSLDRIQSGQSTSSAAGFNDPPISNSLMAAIKRSQAHQRRLPENFRAYQEISQQQSQNTVSCIKVELRQLILSILDDPVVSRIFGEAGFRSSELKLSIIRPIPHVLRYSGPRGQPLFLCDVLGNPEIAPIRWGFNISDRNLNKFLDGDVDYRRISTVFVNDKGRNPLLVGVSAYDVLNNFLNSIEQQTDGILPMGLNVVNIESEIAEQIRGKFDKNYTDTRFFELGKLAENCSGAGVILNYGDLKVFNNGNNGDAANYVVEQVSELLQRHRRRIWLIGSATSNEDYEKSMKKFPKMVKNWDLNVITVTSLRHCLPHHSSLMGSFVPFGGFFTTPDLKVNKEITGLANTEPVSSISNQNLPPWLKMTHKTGLNQQFGVKTKEVLESVFSDKSTSSGSNSVGSAKSVTTDLNLRICSVNTKSNLEKHIDENKDFLQSTSSCIDNPRDINTESFKIIYKRLTEAVSGQEEAARLISSVLSKPPKISSTRRDVWLNLIGPDTIGKRRMALVLAEIVYQSEHRFIAVDLSVGYGMGGCDDAIRLRGKTMVDHIFEVMCRNPFCVVFLENIEKADEKLQISLLKAIETSKFMDSHGREVGIGNTMFVMTSSSSSSQHYQETLYSKVEIQDSRSVFRLNSMNKRKMIDCRIARGKKETAETGKRMNRVSNGVLDLNLPAQETEIEEIDCCEENSKIWLVKFKNHERLIEVPFKSLGFDERV